MCKVACVLSIFESTLLCAVTKPVSADYTYFQELKRARTNKLGGIVQGTTIAAAVCHSSLHKNTTYDSPVVRLI